jgi:hypothetical protein
MCGIWGFITTEKQRGAGGRLRFVEGAALAGTLRGSDSTGAIIIDHNTKRLADWCKVVGTGEEWLGSKYTQEKFTASRAHDMRAVIGHNRSATLGKVTLDNAHPFQEGDITLVHNGTLDSLADLKVGKDKVGTKRKPVEVDSHLITHNLAVHTVDEVIPTLSGAFALVWHDSRNNGIYMIRNSQRPLFLMRAKDEDTTLFASEADMLWWLAGRYQFARGDVVSLDPGVLLEWMPTESKPKARRMTLSYGRTSYSYSAYNSGTSSTTSTGGGSSASAGKPTAVQAVTVGTAQRTKRGRAQLEELGIDPTKTLEFSVEQVIGDGSQVTVNGWAYWPSAKGSRIEAAQAIIHGVNAQYARANLKEDWLVVPLCVWKVGEHQQTCIVCSLVRAQPARPSSGSSALSPIDQFTQPLPGPNGKLISRADWMKQTTGGCIECAAALLTSEAKDILWVNDGTRPLCPECVRKWADKTQASGLN